MPKKKNTDVVDELLADWARERPKLDVEAMAVVGRVIHLSSLLEVDANKVLAPHGLRYTDFDVLATLRRAGKPYELKPMQLRRAVLITSGAMTACLDRLERKGLVRRLPDPDDRRGTLVRLTREGRTKIDVVAPARFAEATNAISMLKKAEIKATSDTLRAVIMELEN